MQKSCKYTSTSRWRRFKVTLNGLWEAKGGIAFGDTELALFRSKYGNDKSQKTTKTGET